MAKKGKDLKRALNFKVTFGKYKGQTLEQISRFDPDYLLWMKRTLDGPIPVLIGLIFEYRQTRWSPHGEDEDEDGWGDGPYYDGEFEDYENSLAEAYMMDTGDR